MFELHFSRAGGFMGLLFLNDIEKAREVSITLRSLGYSTVIIDDINNDVISHQNHT